MKFFHVATIDGAYWEVKYKQKVSFFVDFLFRVLDNPETVCFNSNTTNNTSETIQYIEFLQNIFPKEK